MINVPAVSTPNPVTNICTMDSSVLPLMACAGVKSLSTTVFIAVNCKELKKLKMTSCMTLIHAGCEGAMKAKLATDKPTNKVLIVSTRL